MVAPAIPPHFASDGSGRIADVIRATLARCGHSVRFTIVPFGRHWHDYDEVPEYDALATAEAEQVFTGYSTKPFMHLQDGATVLADSDLAEIAGPQDLVGRRVVAFPSADKILGIEDLVPRFAEFRFRSDRFDQVRPLLAGRADAVLADGLITAHFLQLLRARKEQGLEPDIDPAKPVAFRRIFAKGSQRLYFKESAIRDDFDRCFAELDAAGEVDRIAGAYVDRYRDIVHDQYPAK
jgi:ABC-type amino acid transport substrate-binding protein